jgi:tetratricopeptide (TPR) repeat protein
VALVKQLRGDLDSIALKALEKDRGRRYGSPAEFGADIGRYLRNEAVMAVPPSMAYRTRKFARRYRAALVTAAAFVLVLIAAAGISIRESIRANREASAAQAVNGFLQNDLLSQASAAVQSGPGTKPDPDLKVRTALDRAASRIGGKFQNEPEVEAAIRDTIGQTYLDLGLYSEARKQLERALELHRHVLGAKAPKTLKAINRIARIAWLEGKYGESEKLFEGVLELQRNVMGPEHLDTLDSMLNLGILYFLGGKYAQAEALLSHTLETQRRVLGPENQGTISSMNNLANVYKNQGKYEAAEALYSQNLDIMRRTRGPEHPNTLISMGNLADMYNLEGKYARAESLGGETLAIEQRVLGPEHRYTLVSMNNLADAYAYQGRYREAEALFQKTIETARRVLGPRHPLTLDFVAELAAMYQREGKYALAEGYAAEVLAAERRVLGQEHLDTMGSVANLALAYVSEERFSAAEPLAREAFEFNRRTQPDDPARFRAESVLGASLAGQKGYAEAELLLLEGYQGMVARKAKMGAPEWYYLDRVRDWIIRMYEEWGKPQKAAEWRKAGKS